MNEVDIFVVAGAVLLLTTVWATDRLRWLRAAWGLALLFCACTWARTLAMQARSEEIIGCIQRVVDK